MRDVAMSRVERGKGVWSAATPVTVPGWLPPLLVFGTIAARRWWQQGSYPTGLDGGQWLALGRDLGGPGRSTDGAYPPLVPLLVQAAQTVLDPLDALRFVAAGSLLAVMVATYLVTLAGTGPLLALAVAATVGLASAVSEPVAFGGYPQHVAFASLLVATWGLARFLASGGRRYLFVGAASLAAAAFAHHVYFPLAIATCGLVWLAWLSTRPGRAALVSRGLAVGGAVVLGIICFLPTALAFRAAGYDPPLDASRLDVVEAFRYGTREAPRMWAIAVALGMASLALTVRCRRSPTWQIAAALLATALGLFGATAEVRLLPPVLTGAVLGLGIGVQRLRELGRGGRLAALPLLAALAVPVLLWPAADAAAANYFRYYRVVDGSLLGAADAVTAAGDVGTVVVRHDRRGWPIGWWFEGLTEADVAVGSDPRWLGFPDEQTRAALAARFFDRPLTGSELTDLADRTGVSILAFRKWEWIGWQRWLDEPAPPVTVLYDDDRFMVVRVGRE